MPIFQYRGYRSDGSEVTGTLEASSHKDAVVRLKDSGLYPKTVQETIYKKRFSIFRRSDPSLLPLTTRQLSTLLSSGVPLMDALSSIAEEHKGYWQNMLISVKERIEGGSSLSKALEGYEKTFPEFYVNMVAAGEASGTLDIVLSIF